MNKKTFKPSKKKAFSLIELSIVLIIIGLLVAGVTGGASLIRNAELRGVMNEARGYATAVNSFYVKFNALPGDFGTELGTMIGTSTVGGNANGFIEFYNSNSTASTVAGRMESNIAWQHLIEGVFIDDNFTPITGDAGTSGVVNTTAQTPGTNIPGSKFQNAGWIFDYVNSQNTVIVTAAFTPDDSASTSAVNATPVAILTPIDAFSIDTKVDDADAADGRVRDVTDSGCSSSGTYATSTKTAACTLSFQVDPNS